ncbi:hypothetical protein [Gymnodinialimonas sp.]
MFEVEPTKETQSICDCCGNRTHAIMGFVHESNGDTLAHYTMQWTVEMPFDSHPANFDLIFGRWGEGTGSDDRCAISLIYYEEAGRQGVMVINAKDRPVASSNLVSTALMREDVVGTDLAKQVFAVFDSVLLGDKRLAHFDG